ncbi:MAG: HAD family hydrolase [Bradyrhizobiaceae bacterium]|nr:MAG: HAD family hydrolase [Bradyrhizobiaceae bacterium]
MSGSDFRTVILDFDNTLYDWVAQWYYSFSAMLGEIHRISGIPLDVLKEQIRAIHQKHHTSEYAFLIEHLDIIRDGSVEATIAKYRPAIEKFREARTKHLVLYPGVMDTLINLRSSGKTLVVFTESQTFYTVMRFKHFGLDGLIDFLFTSDDHETPDNNYLEKIRSRPSEYYEIQNTKHRSVGKGRLKPDPAILRQIIDEVGSTQRNSVYVGDSLYKDVLMAKEARVFGVWAQYGEARGQPGYDLLREVSHWTDEDVERDRSLKKRDVKANAILKTGFPELLGLNGL